MLVLTTLLATLCGSLLLVIASACIRNMINIRRAINDFKVRSNGIPMADNASLISGHILVYLFGKHLNETLREMHERFGKTYAFMYRDKPSITTSDVELIRQVILTDPNMNINRPHLDLPISEYDQDSLLFAVNDQWRRIRRAVTPALSKQKFKTKNVVKEVEGSIAKMIGGFERRFRDRISKDGKDEPEIVVDIDDLAHRFALDSVYSSFYKQYNLIDFDAERDKLTDIIDSGMASIHSNPLVKLSVVFPIIRPILDWLIWHFHPQGKWRQSIMNFIKAQTKLSFEARKRLSKLRAQNRDVNEENFVLEDGTKFNRNMMDTVSDAFHDGKMTKSEYFHTAFFLFTAAEKTSSDAIARTIYYLSIHEEIQDKTRACFLAEGIDSQYFDWVVNETLRLCPPAQIGSTRVLTQDIPVPDKSGKVVPKGTIVVTSVFSIHRLPEYWGDDAEEFKPERWANAANFHPVQFMPFGIGIRYCPGKDFALFELKSVIGALLSRYKFKGEDKPLKFDVPFLTFLVHDEPTYIRVSRLQKTPS